MSEPSSCLVWLRPFSSTAASLIRLPGPVPMTDPQDSSMSLNSTRSGSSALAFSIDLTASSWPSHISADRTVSLHPSKLPSRSAKPALDRIDLLILDALRDNGRITYQALSERVGLSARPCLERVRRLEQKGVIRGYTAQIDPSALGHDIIALAGISMRDPSTGPR